MVDQIICSKCGSPNPKDTVFCGKCGKSLLDENTGVKEDPLIGSFVGDRFLVHEKLGEGGMGVVYRAEQTAIKREVALKVLHANMTQDESLYARFQNEAAAASRLNHPNTVTIYDFGKTKSDSLYIAMEFIKGRSLDAEINDHGAMNVKRACHIAVQIAGSLQDAHDNNIVHRDLKPENVMLCARGGDTDVVKVLDFGIAKIVEDDGKDQRKALTKTGMVFGTPQYMSPEQIRGDKVDNRTDIYSLGVIIYQMLRGALPFNAENPMGLLTKHLMDTPPPLAVHGIPKEIESVVMATLEKDASRRPPSMKDLANRLSAAAGLMGPGAVTEAMPVQAPKKTAHAGAIAPKQAVIKKTDSAEKKTGIIAAVVVGVLLLIGGSAAAWYLLAGPGAKPAEQTIAIPTAQPPAYPSSLAQLGQISPSAAPASTGMAVTAPAMVPTPAPLPAAGILTGPVDEPNKKEPSKSSSKKGEKDKKKGTTPPVVGIPEQPVNGKLPVTEPPKIDPGKTLPVKQEPAKPNPKPETPTPKKPVACKFSGGSDSVDSAIVSSLRKRELAIRNCIPDNSKERTVFSFNVDENGDRPTNLKTIHSAETPQVKCLKAILSNSFQKQQTNAKRGTVMFMINKQNNVIDACSVNVKTMPDVKKLKIH